MSLDPRIEAVRAAYGLSSDDFWQIPQNRQWVCKHAALEVVAVKAKVEWLPPQIIEANAPDLVTSMVVTGKIGDRVEWATGETNPTNYSVKGKQPAYPWAMSEKRAKDRVVLKLVGIHGLVYSEDESDDFKAPSEPATKSSAQLKRENAFEEFERELDECKTLVALDKFRKFWGPKTVQDGWTAAWKSAARDRIEGREKAIMDEVDRLSNASDEELAGMPVRDTLNASLNTLAGG